MALFKLPSETTSSLFEDRADAGAQLAQAVLERSQALDAAFVVYALPRGGVPIGAAIARVLQCPLDVVVAKKITRPQNPELAIGAVTADGHVLQASTTRMFGWEAALNRAQTKAQEQLAQFVDRPAVTATDKIALLVDDGIATGMTILVAAEALREQHPQEIWICAPIAPASLIDRLVEHVDRVIVLATPDPFYSVSQFYRSFPQVELDAAIADLRNSLQSG